jgi:hypothetical protein
MRNTSCRWRANRIAPSVDRGLDRFVSVFVVRDDLRLKPRGEVPIALAPQQRRLLRPIGAFSAVANLAQRAQREHAQHFHAVVRAAAHIVDGPAALRTRPPAGSPGGQRLADENVPTSGARTIVGATEP